MNRYNFSRVSSSSESWINHDSFPSSDRYWDLDWLVTHCILTRASSGCSVSVWVFEGKAYKTSIKWGNIPNTTRNSMNYLRVLFSWLWRGFKAYFRKAGHAFVMNKKKHILISWGQFKDQTSIKFLNCENLKNISKMSLRAGL